ncbi:unnamed protein product [Adineta steineri]|uniref:Mono(ADP-ribosyl)transferase n=1 Tax=Adineta steineri TaxID=433720 RepID=A0A818WG86_9BILA|nr:unnamed protein product [Adineta steineri]CAF3725186.1 unnamed protein product [Adineta steineri]
MNSHWWGVSSCTVSFEVLQQEHFLGAKGLRTLFSIECQNGKSAISHSYFKDSEKEIILMPGSYFEVMGQLHPANDLHIIRLKEIQPPFALVKPPFKKESMSTPIKESIVNSKEKKADADNTNTNFAEASGTLNKPLNKRRPPPPPPSPSPPPPPEQKKVKFFVYFLPT